MSVSFDIASGSGNYRITISRGQTLGVVARESNEILIIDRQVRMLFNIHATNVLQVEVSEDAKSLEAMSSYVAKLRQLGANRETRVIAIGGGTVQDISTFVCSIYMRGLNWSYLPTTLLAMVDSCIGGKSAINAGGFKNLVGNFYPPQCIEIDLDLINSMPSVMRAEGLIEAAKICFARGDQCFRKYIAQDINARSGPKEIGEIIELSLNAKKWFVEVDEFDQSERLLLNFGHTFGHAIESASKFLISHGVAVGLGMLIACRLADQFGNCTDEGSIVFQLCQHIRSLLSEVPDLQAMIQSINSGETILGHFKTDKKHGLGVYRIIIPDSCGVLSLRELPQNGSSDRIILEAMQEVLRSLSEEYDCNSGV